MLTEVVFVPDHVVGVGTRLERWAVTVPLIGRVYVERFTGPNVRHEGTGWVLKLRTQVWSLKAKGSQQAKREALLCILDLYREATRTLQAHLRQARGKPGVWAANDPPKRVRRGSFRSLR